MARVDQLQEEVMRLQNALNHQGANNPDSTGEVEHHGQGNVDPKQANRSKSLEEPMVQSRADLSQPIVAKGKTAVEVENIIRFYLDKADLGPDYDEHLTGLIREMNQSPFSEEILASPVPKNFTIPYFVLYTGATDPIAHLRYFRQVMTLYQGDDAVLCKVFPSSLNECAMAWFYRLKPNSVTSFTSLSIEFVKKYVFRIQERKRHISLYKMVMHCEESLKDYVERFETAALLVDDLDQNMALGAFTQGLPPGHSIHCDIVVQGIKRYQDAKYMISRYIDLDEETERSQNQRNFYKPKRARN